MVIFLETSRLVIRKFYKWLDYQNFPKYFSKMSEVFLEIFQNLSRNFLKWFSKFSDKIFMWRTSLAITLRIPHTPLAAMVIWVRALETVGPRHHNCFYHCRHRCAKPMPHPAPPLFTSVSFFVTLRFCNLVPYVAILKVFHKTFHIKIGEKLKTSNQLLPPLL